MMKRMMKVIVISSILTIILIITLPFIFLFSTQTSADNNEGYCDSSYPAVCIPLYPPDLNCDDIPKKNFDVLPPDRHGFDRDDDIGCES
jgi:hypothetical protein